MAKKTRKRKSLKYYEGIGRRKSAVARVRLYVVPKGNSVSVSGEKIKKGQIYVNQKPIEKYFPGEVTKKRCRFPFELTENKDRFAVSVLVKGGGKTGQIDAIILGASRALEKTDKSYRTVLKEHKLLTRDARVKERRKPGTGGKARRKKQSPKR